MTTYRFEQFFALRLFWEWTFSPDGRQIAFVYRPLQQYKIYLVDSAAGRSREIIKHAVPESRICWTPDGKRLLYVSGKGSEENIWMLVIKDGRFKQITSNAAIDHSPCLSSDGEKLIFSSQRDGDNWQLYLTDLWKRTAGEKPIRLTTDSYNYRYPDWF